MLNVAQMLRQTKSVATMLADNSALCSSKDIILEKLNGLAAQVLAEMKTMNVTDTSKYEASTDAHKVSILAQPLQNSGRRILSIPFLSFADAKADNRGCGRGVHGRRGSTQRASTA
jgi:hypothetical protein